jgi:predicted Zn finger-like uncharacterized protein
MTGPRSHPLESEASLERSPEASFEQSVEGRASSARMVKRAPIELVEDQVESRALFRETAGAFALLGLAFGGLALGFVLAGGFLMKLSFVLSGVALWTCALVAVWPRTRRFAARINRIRCPACGAPYRVSTDDILADVGNVRLSKTRSPAGFTCYEVMCTGCGIAHRFRRSGRLAGKSPWRRDRETEAEAKQVAERALASFDAGDFAAIWRGPRMFWDGLLRDRAEWLADVARGRSCLGRANDRQKVPIVRWSNHPDGVAYVHYLEERELDGSTDSPFRCEDYVSFTWTTVFGGVVASECLLLGALEGRWSVIGYRIDGISDYVQLDGVGRLSLQDPDERGSLSLG